MEGAGPLAGIRVLDVSRLVAGNITTHLLADFGAEVIKVENPDGGDDLRAWQANGVSASWKVYARNKKSVSLDLRQEGDRDLFLQLVETSQILVENFTPGTLEKWGLAPAILLERNPLLVILRISGWGQTGPLSKRPGFGTLVEAMSGFASMNGFSDRPPVLPPFALADSVAGLYGACALLIAIRNVEMRQGSGQVIDLSLFESLFSVLGANAAEFAIAGTVKTRNGSQTEITAPRNVYECSDGKFVALSAATQGMTKRLFRAIARDDLLIDERFATNSTRVANHQALDRIIQEFMASRTQQEALALFEREEVTVGPVRDISELMVDPYVRERGVITMVPDDDLGAIAMHSVVPRMSVTPGSIRTPAPALGEHNEEILGPLGKKISALNLNGDRL